MEKKMENFKEKGRLSRRFSSRKGLGSLKTRFKRFLSDRHVKAGKAEDRVFSPTGSDSDIDGRKVFSPPPERSGEIRKSSGSGSYSGSDDESKLEKKAKLDASSDSSEEKEKEKGPSKSSRTLQLHLQQDRQELFRLPPLEETPPTSPQSNPRFSTGAQSDYARLWSHASVPNSPANLAYNFNLSYRGGDSSPVALVHSLSVKDRGKHPSQLSEISYASPPSASSLDLDVLGVKLEDLTASPTKTTPSLKPNGLPVVHHDEEQGVWRCASCGWIYPNPNPSLRNRREHKDHCGEFSSVQRWLGAQDIQDAPGKGSVELEDDSEVWEGSGSLETLSTADENPMGKIHEQDITEGVPHMPFDHHGSVDQGMLDDIEAYGSPDHDAVGDEGNGGRSPGAAALADEVEDQKLNRAREWPSLDARTKDQSSAEEMLSNGSNNHHEATDLEEVFNGSSARYGIEEVGKLDDSASFMTPEAEKEKDVQVQVDQDHYAFGDEVNDRRSPNAVTNPDENEDQNLNRVPEWRTLDAGSKDQSSADEMLSNGSSNHHEVTDRSKLEDVSNGSSFHYGIEKVGKLDDSASFIIPETEKEQDFEVEADQDHYAFGDEGNGGRSPNAAANPEEVEDQNLNRVPEWPTLDAGRKDQSSADEMLSNGSSNQHKVSDHSKLEDVSNRPSLHYGIEEVSKLDESAFFTTPEAEKGKGVEVEADQDHYAFGYGDNGGRSPNAAANPEAVEDQNLNRVPEWRTLDAGRRDQSSADEMQSNGSSNHHEATDQRKLGDVSNGSTVRHGIEEVSKLDDSAPEVENEKDESEEVKADQGHDAVGDGGNGGISLSAAANPDEVEDQRLNRVLEWPALDAGTKDQSSAQETLSNGSTNHHEATDHSKLDDVSSAHHGIEEVSKFDDSASCITPEVENESDEAVEVKADQEEVNGDVGSSHVICREVESHESQSGQRSHQEMENEAGDVQVQLVSGNGNRSLAVVHTNGHDFVHGDSIAGFKEDDNANRDFNDHLNHPDDIGPTEVPEVYSEQSALTSDTGVQGIDNVRIKGDLDNQIPGDDGFSKEAVPVAAVEMEPRIVTHKGRPIVLAEVVREPDLMEPSLSRADLQCRETEIESRDVKALTAVAREPKNVDMVIPMLTKLSHSQSNCLEPEKDTKTDGIVSDHGSEQKASEIDSVEGNSTRVLPSQANGITTENGGTLDGLSSRLEEAPKWVSSVMITSQDEEDTFTSMQKYWAGMTGSEYLLVDGKRSPSFGSSDNIGFPSFRKGEGRRSPSPFSLGKSGDVEVESSPSSVSVDYHSTVEDGNKERAMPSLTAFHLDGSSSSSAHVNYDLEKVVHEQNTHDLLCPVCGSDVTRRIILKKRKKTQLQDDEKVSEAIMTQQGGRVEHQTPQVDESDDETWGCLACLSFFISRGDGEGRLSQALVRGPEEQIPSVSGELMGTEQERIRCLPTLFRLGHGTSKPDVSKEEEDGAEIAKPMAVSTGHLHEIPLDEDESVSCFSYLQRSKQEPPVKEKAIEEFHSGSSHPVDDPIKEGTSESLPPSVPAFHWGTSSKYDLPPSLGVVSSHQEITSVIDGPEEAPTSLTQEPQGLKDANERGSYNCLPELLPAVSWGSIPVYTHPPLDMDESAGMEQHEEPSASSGTASLTKEPKASEDAEEKRSCNFLPDLIPAVSWGSIPVYTHPPLGTDESAEMEQQEDATAVRASASMTQEPQLLGDAEDKETCNCLPELSPALTLGPIPVFTHPPPDTYEFSGEEHHEEASAGGPSASVTQQSQPLGDAEDKGACNCLPEVSPAVTWGPIPVFTHPPPDTYEFSGEDQSEEASAGGPSASVTQQPQPLGDAEDKGACNCLPEVSPAVTWGPIPVFTHPPPDTYEFSGEDQSEEASAGGPSASVTQQPQPLGDAEDKGACNCLPEVSPAVTWGPIPVFTHPPPDTYEFSGEDQSEEASAGGPSASVTQQPQPLGDAEDKGACNCLPEVSPAVTWGPIPVFTHPPPDTYEFSGEDQSEEASAGGPSASVTQQPQPLGDAEDKGACNCLPEVSPAVTWGPIPVFTHPPPDTYEFSGEDQSEEASAGGPSASVTQQPQPLGDAEDKGACNCLPEVSPAVTWGPIPVFTHPPPDTYEFSGEDQSEEASAGGPSASVTQQPQPLGDAEDKGACNCLPEVSPAVTWGPIPVFTHPPPDTYEFSGEDQSEEASAGGPSASVTQQPQPLGDAEDKGACNCLPEVSPAVTWGPIPVFTHPPPDTYEFSGEDQHEEASSGGPSASETQEPQAPEDENSGENGSFNCLSGLLPTFSWRSSPQAPTGRIDEDLLSSHLEAKERATCACLPLFFPTFNWGFTRTIYGKGLEEPLLPQDSPAAGPVPFDNNSTRPMQTTVPVADPPSVIDDGDGRQITELEDFHIEGIVSSQKTFTRAEPSEKRADFIDSDFNGHLSNYHFAVDIKDGHFTGTVKKLQPEFPPLNICNGDVVSSTDSSYLSARAGPEPGQAPVEASPVLEGDLSDFKHLAQAIADHLGEDKPKHETRSCNCFPTSLPIVSWWRPSMSSTVGEGLEKYLLGKVEENQDENNTVGMSLSTGETQVELQRGQPSVNGTGEICNCLPSLHKFPLYDVFRDHQVSADPWLPGTEVGDMTTPLLGRTPQNAGTVVEIDHSEISVAVEGATSAEAAAGASAVAQGQSRSPSEGDRAPLEYLKSVVHGGLDVTLVSLGVVASAAGGDAKTITVVALGLANLVFGLITHLSVIMSLYYNNRTQFKEEVGQGFIHGCLSFISFLFFGSLSPITYGFSFRNATSHNFKFAATCVVALVSIVLLGAARARVKSKSTVRVIYILVFTGFLASIAGYGTGNLVAQLLEQFGFFSV